MTPVKKEIKWGDRTLSLEVGRVAQQANSAVLARYGDTMVLCTVVSNKPKEEYDYFPLTVDYEERLYAAGRISTSRFIKREGRPTEEAVLNGRLIDRSIRPLFPKDYFNEVQVIITVLSYDQENEPDILSLVATSAALSISDVPWDGPIVASKVGLINGNFVLNPTKTDMASSEMELVVSSNGGKVVMIESGAKQVAEETLIKSLEFSLKEAEPIKKLINELVKEVGKEKQVIEEEVVDKDLKSEVIDYVQDHFKEKLFNAESGARERAGEDFKEELYKIYEGKLSKTEMAELFDKTIKQMVRQAIIDEKKRPDGRKLDEVREITSEVGILPRTHGSAIFKRGDTQVLSVATLGSTSLEQLIDGMYGEETKRFMHHYTFPPYSTGEVRRVGSPGRREIGHGALAEKAILPVIPAQDKFPYTIRVVSEVMSSSGSTSMGSTCGSILALMDAGVPITAPVSGIAMGLVTENEKWEILTDIQALEDFYGDMDFKIAGTEKGITAIQLDVKIPGLTMEMVKKALTDGRKGRLFILEKMLSALPQSRSELSQYAPKITVIHIPPKKIGEVIGSGGKTINSIIDATGVAIDIEDDGTVMISSNDPEASQKAVEWIEGLTKEVKPGEVYEGTVKRIMPFGAFVEMLPGKEGMVHVSQIAAYRVEDINKELKVGQKVKVKVLEIDSQGRVNLTMKFDE